MPLFWRNNGFFGAGSERNFLFDFFFFIPVNFLFFPLADAFEGTGSVVGSDGVNLDALSMSTCALSFSFFPFSSSGSTWLGVFLH